MSLDNISQLGRQGPDELVPSRYALRVGEIDVLVIRDGCYRSQPRRSPATPTRPTWRPGSMTCSCPRTYASGR
jgi:hypothetical protein